MLICILALHFPYRCLRFLWSHDMQDVRHYSSFSELLEAESLPEVLPGVKSIEEGSGSELILCRQQSFV